MAGDTLQTPSTADLSNRLFAARGVIYRNVLWSLGACAVPVPVLDVVAIVAVEVKLLAELSALYGVPFREALATKLVLSLLAGVGGHAAGVVVVLSLGKVIPGFGSLLGFATSQLFAGAFTHATGQVYVMHLETGGTLLDLDPRAVRAHFRREFAAGKRIASDLRVTVAAVPTSDTQSTVTAPARPFVIVAAAPEIPAAPEPLASPAATIAAALTSNLQAAPAGVTIVRVHHKGAVKRTRADEYAEIVNHGDAAIDVSGWILDAGDTGQVFTFPSGTTLAPGQVVRVYTDEVHPDTGGFKFGIHRAIWSDHGDRARLRDASGAVVSVFAYGNKQ